MYISKQCGDISVILIMLLFQFHDVTDDILRSVMSNLVKTNTGAPEGHSKKYKSTNYLTTPT